MWLLHLQYLKPTTNLSFSLDPVPCAVASEVEVSVSDAVPARSYRGRRLPLPAAGTARLPTRTGHCQELHYSFCFNPLMWIQVAVSVPRLWHSNKWLAWEGGGEAPDPGNSGWGPRLLSPRRRPPSPGGHCFGAGQWESPILKHSAIFSPWSVPSAVGGSLARRRTPARLPPRPAPSPALGGRPSQLGLSLRQRAHARADSRSHWLLPVANPRDRRRRAPPPSPAPAGSGSAARSCWLRRPRGAG